MFRFILLTTLSTCLRANSLSTASIADTVAMTLKRVDFEVFGRVQGVFFRKYTKGEADKLGLKGWCRNTSAGTVEGQMEGPTDKIDAMKHWLMSTGSPTSKIDKAEFKNDKDITDYSFNNFEIRRDDEL